MKVSLITFEPNINSTELDKIYIRDVYVGELPHSLLSEWYLSYEKRYNTPVPIFWIYIAGVLRERFHADMKTPADIEALMEKCEKECKMSLIKLIEEIIEKEIG